MATILVVDDEPTLVAAVRYGLQRDGHAVLAAGDGIHALDLAHAHRPDLIVLDLMLPGIDGLEVCRALRQSAEPRIRLVHVVVLSARAEERDKLVALEAGADDYVTKPFSTRELRARINAALRRMELDRAQDPTEPPGHTLVAGEVEIDLAQRRVLRRPGAGGRAEELRLRPREFDLLAFLMQQPGRVFTRQELLDQVWGSGFAGTDRTVDVHIYWLRQKIERHPSRPSLLQAVRGVGYRLQAAGPGTVAAPRAPSSIIAGDMQIDPARREVHVGERLLQLPRREFDLLWYLAQHAGLTLSRAQLLEAVWPELSPARPDTRTVESHVHRLRERIEPDPAHPRYLHTVRGLGYRFEPAGERSPAESRPS